MTTNESSTSHPGTSGRSPAPPRGASAAGGGVSASAAGGGGRPSIGASTTTSSAMGGGHPSLDATNNNPGRLSYGSAMHGMRLSYGSAAVGVGAGAGAAGAGGMTPGPHNFMMSPPSTTSTHNNVHNYTQSDFLTALSPATAKFLKGGKGAAAGGGGAGAGIDAVGDGGTSDAFKGTGELVQNNNAAQKKDDGNADNDEAMADNIAGDNVHQNQPNIQPATNNLSSIGQDVETIQLRNFVQSLLGMQLPASTLNINSMPSMTTPDPTTAAFYATSLLTKTAQTINGQTYWRPDDAYLAARALSLKGEHKRAIWIMDRVGLIGFGIGSGSEGGAKEGDVGGGIAESQHLGSSNQGGLNVSNIHQPAVSNEQGIRNALLLRAEAALLAGQCLTQSGEYERALTVYEEAMRCPPPPPPVEWGLYGYGYRLDNMQNSGEEYGEEGATLNAKLADEMYIRTWREQSLSHMALIDDGDDERLLGLATNLRSMPFTHSTDLSTVEGIHPLARLCAARGIAYDAISNPHRAVPFLRVALTIDVRCMEALDYVVKRRLLTPEEEREWISSLNFGNEEGGELGSMGISWLRDAYLARLRGSGGVGVMNLPPTTLQEQVPGRNDNADVSPVARVDMQSPSMLSLGSPDFAGGAAGGGRKPAAGHETDPFESKAANAAAKASSISQTIDEAFRNLAIHHHLGQSPDVLAHAAIRAYALHDLQSALAYCTAIDAIDPYCRTAGYVHVATLVGLNLKRRLFQLAHRLVDTDPKDALAWFAVGCYYYSCRRYDLAQRHFSRSTRLDPSCAECWIGFGCSFAVCDESDQALASFRAAQNKYSGSHVPLLYMGMEYLRTNHLSLAGHFLNSAQRTDPCDMLCCNELGVWSYRQGDMEDAAFWFIKALRLNVRAKGSALNSTDEGLGMNGYILLTGQEGQAATSGGAANQATNTVTDTTTTPYVKRKSSNNEDEPPMSTVLCAVKTPSGHSIAASIFSDAKAMDNNDGLTDTECIERCKDQFWEPTIFNLGQSYRKMKRYGDAIVCFRKCASLNPGNYAAYAALGFAKHLAGDVDGAIDSYHEALSRKPEDPFTSEMLTRALAEAVTYPPSLAMLDPAIAEVEGEGSGGGVGSSILKKMGAGKKKDAVMMNDQDTSMITSNTNDVDMSLAEEDI